MTDDLRSLIQEVLGHRSMRQTSDTYSHVSESMMASAMAAMARVVGALGAGSNLSVLAGS